MDTLPAPDPWAGLTERYNPKTKRTEWVEWSPDACPYGHATLLTQWIKCLTCGYACRHWTCSSDGCDGEVVDPRHVCDAEREVDPRRR